MTYKSAVLGFGAFFTVVAFICLLVAVCTNQWLIIQVDQSSLTVDTTDSSYSLAFFTRSRGLFRECFENTAAVQSYIRENEFKDEFNECLKTDFMMPRRWGVAYTDDYKLRVDLQISMVVFLCFSLLLCVVGFGVFCYSCAMMNVAGEEKSWRLATKWSGIIIFLAAFFNAGGMAFYHGAELVETRIIANGNEVPYNFYFRGAQPTVLQEATTRLYSWSYALGWLAVFFEVMAAVMLFVCGACCGRRDRREKGQFLDFSTMNSSRSYGQRNLAYEYMEGKAPVVYEAQPQRQIINDASAYHDHFRGRHFDPYSRQPAQQIEAVPQYNFDNGGWSWQQ